MSGNLKLSSLKNQQWSGFVPYISLFLIFFGVLVRLIQYLNNRSLWFDEINLAINIVNRSYLELAQTLDRNQAAPLGFLWIEKLATQVLGDSEYALRLFPFVASIVAMVAFYRLANRYSSTFAAPIAIALFACGRYTIYYATELKQYSSDVAIALILCLSLIPLRRQFLSTKQILTLALLGGLAIWFSHPAVFTLAGLEGAYLLTAPTKQRLKLIINRIPIYFTWLTSFGLFYTITIAGTMNNAELANSWESRYPDSIVDIVWLLDAFGRFFYRPMGFPGVVDAVAMVAFIVGCIVYYRTNQDLLIALTAPFVATLIASYLHKYPFRERLILFLAPLAMLIIAEGIVFLISRFRDRSLSGSIIGLVGAIFLCALILPTVSRANKLVINPELKHEIRPVIEYIASHDRPGDIIYVHQGKQQFIYYADKFGYAPQDYILSPDNLSDEDDEISKWRKFPSKIKPFYGRPRVWFVATTDDAEAEAAALVKHLNRFGGQVDSFKQPGAFVYLYDLSNSAR